MKHAALPQIVRYADQMLGTTSFPDYDGASNGLQVENSGRVKKIVACVDASFETVRLSAAAGASLMIVHHGLFWSKTHPWTGRRYELLRLLVENDIAVYSSHLPLDAHPKVGNSAELARALGFKSLKPFFAEKGRSIGWRTEARVTRNELTRRLQSKVGGPVTLLPGGPVQCRRIGIVTGGAGSHIATAAAEGVDTFITGEGPHWTFPLAEDLGLNVFYAGHYNTETFGVKKLAAAISARFKVPWSFIDRPSGL